MWVSPHITIGVDSEVIINNKTRTDRNNDAIGALQTYQENYTIFNGNRRETNDFVNMKSP